MPPFSRRRKIAHKADESAVYMVKLYTCVNPYLQNPLGTQSEVTTGTIRICALTCRISLADGTRMSPPTARTLRSVGLKILFFISQSRVPLPLVGHP